MSSAGINPLAIIAPDLYAKQLVIQRRQALAQSLMEQGGGNAGASPYGGLANAGKSLLGAFLARGADKDTAALYAPQPDQSQPQTPPGAGQVSNTPTMPASPPDQPPGAQPPVQSGPSPQAMGAALTGGSPQGGQPMAQPQQSPQQPRTIPNAMAGAIPDLPGRTHIQSMLEYYQDPQDYWKESASTPEYRNALVAAGGDPNLAQTILMGAAKKAANVTARAGNMNTDMMTGQMVGVPNANGMTPVQLPNGQIGMQMAPGAADALTATNYAQGLGKSTSNIGPVIGPDQQTRYMPMGQAAGIPPPGQSTPNIDRNNPLNVSPGGQVSKYTTPTAGLIAASENLSKYADRGINTVAGVMNTWAPYQDVKTGRVINPSTPDNIKMIAGKLGVDPNQPINLRDPNVKGQLIDLMRPTETGNRYAQATGVVSPSAAAISGSTTFQNSVAGSAGSEWKQTHDMAADSPTRINVLQNIMKLSALGAPTGSTEWMNQARETAAAIGQATGLTINANNPAALMTEIQKYMGQYSNRMAQGQGGTGTDKQLEAVQEANPNESMFPQTLQRVVPWIMANERGIQAKANFLDAQPGALNDPKAQVTAQNKWRNLYQPRVAQFELMTPQQQSGYLAEPRAFSNAGDRQKFIQSAMALHPYFTQAQ